MGTNTERAATARTALDAYVRNAFDSRGLARIHPSDRVIGLGDLLCNLRHYADEERIDFAEAEAQAEFHYDHESQYGPNEQVP